MEGDTFCREPKGTKILKKSLPPQLLQFAGSSESQCSDPSGQVNSRLHYDQKPAPFIFLITIPFPPIRSRTPKRPISLSLTPPLWADKKSNRQTSFQGVPAHLQHNKPLGHPSPRTISLNKPFQLTPS